LEDASSALVAFQRSTAGLPVDESPELAAELGAGAAVADLDADGHLDIVLLQAVGDDFVCWGEGGAEFDCVPGPWPDSNPVTPSLAASIADYNADGNLDIGIVGLDRLHLLRNLGARQFVDVTAAAGLQAEQGFGTAMSWADIDGDGDLDLWVGWHAIDVRHAEGLIDDAPNQLWLQTDGAFALAPPMPWGGGIDGAAFLGLFRDFDGDGDPDLLVINDVGYGIRNSALWENRGGVWVDRIANSGLGVLAFPMGASVVDLDGDGVRDLLFTDIGRPRAFQGQEPWTFVEQPTWTAVLPTGETWVSWSAVPLDLRGDGRPVLALAYGALQRAVDPEYEDPRWWSVQPDRLLDPTTWETLPLLPPESGPSRGIVVADFDEDMAPDLLILQVDGSPELYLSRDGGGARLTIDLRDPTSPNRFAVGASVTVETDAAAFTQEVAAGGPGTFCDGGPTLYFGLGDSVSPPQITVRWPDGATDLREETCLDCRLLLVRGE
jgi:hypothetical protein